MKGIQEITKWIDKRIPIFDAWREHASRYFTPKNFNFWYYFGSLSMFIFVNQILTGIWLTMYYTPTADSAFASVEYIMRDVHYGWLIRYLHSTGASAFFALIYLHMFRSLLYGSHKAPRELVWLIGMGLYLCLMAEAFFGYLLPWGQMSYWGAQVITSLFGAIPYIGSELATWVRGDYNVSDVTLHRFFALHVIGLPLLMVILMFLHIVALHRVGSNNPDGIEIKDTLDEEGKPKDGIPFHPYYTIKDSWGLGVFLMVFLLIVFFAPEMGGYFLEHANFIPADPLTTPEHIAPVWYMTPFYTILRAVPNKLLGVICMGASIAVLFFLPWLDRGSVRSIRYRGMISKIALGVFVICFLSLGYLGTVEVTPTKQLLAQIFSLGYFLFFFFMPIISRYEKTKAVPKRLT